MGHDVEDGSGIGAYAESEEHIAELAYCGIGQDFFNIVLLERYGSGEQGSCESCDGYHGLGGRGEGIQDITAGDHVDACCYHGGSMDEGRNGCWSGHGIG